MRGILLAVVAALCAVPTAAATHMGWYAQFPVEHDDQGRSEEPDGARTGVLGVEVRNCVIGTSLTMPGCTDDPPGEGPLAPGCHDDSGRQPSGVCGTWTVGIGHPWVVEHEGVPPHTIGFGGPGCQASPGAFTRGCRAVRFLDVQASLLFVAPTFSGMNVVQVNRKFHDAGAPQLLGAAGLAGGDALVGSTAIWAWYGTWLDRNGNGVIDHLGDRDGQVDANNEFVWLGNCVTFAGEPPPPGGVPYCRVEPSVFPLWVWPGNHHSYCGGVLPFVGDQFSCYALAADVPGREAVCFADALETYLGSGALPYFCPRSFDDFGDVERDFFGDPLLGAQDSVAPDGFMNDRTGDPDLHTRQWAYGLGWATWFYDASAFTSTVVVGGPTSRPWLPWQPFDFAAFHALDVDHYRALHPATDALLQGQVKPAARSHWLLLRDSFVPLGNWTDGVRHHALLDTSGIAGPLDDALLDPGFSREPNTRWDRFPHARFDVHPPSDELSTDEQRHRGWLNDYESHLGAWHAFGDVVMSRVFPLTVGWRTPIGCFPSLLNPSCTSAAFSGSAQPLSPTAPGGHRRTLEPGLWDFRGFLGAWRDAPHVLQDEVWDPVKYVLTRDPATQRSTYVTAPDGWVGNLVNTTGTWRYRGYPAASDPGAPTCTIAGVSARRDFAACHPYWSGATAQASPYGGPFQDVGVDLEDPQAPKRSAGEFEGLFPFRSVLDMVAVKVFPALEGNCDRVGSWTAPALAWRHYQYWRPGDVSAFEDYTGRFGAEAVITFRLGTSANLHSFDLLVLPHGNAGLTICTVLDERVVVALPGRGIVVDEPLRDVDVYAPWGPATP